MNKFFIFVQTLNNILIGKNCVKSDDIAFFILSFDNFKVTWQPCIDHLFDAWQNCPYPVYLLNNFIPSQDDRVKNLLVGEDLNWTDTLKKGLQKVENKRIFFIYDDSFITKVNLNEVELMFNIAIENDLDSLALRKKRFDKGTRFNEKIYKIRPTTKYRNSLFLNLIKKDLLLDLLKSGENNWQFEKEGNNRSKQYDFYSVYNSSLIKYQHGIIKGKWIPKVYTYLENKGYSLSENSLEKHSKFGVLRMNVYTFIFYVVQKFLHSFK